MRITMLHPATFLSLLFVLLNAAFAQGQGSLTYVTAGSTGVQLNYMVTEDPSGPNQFVAVMTANACGAGFALATANPGNTFPLGSGAGSVQKGIADSTGATTGNLLVGGTTPGTVLDSGTPNRNGVSLGTCIVGVALATVSAGGTVPLLFDGAGSFGNSDIVTTELLAGTPSPLPATLTTLNTTSSINGGADINASGVVNANGAGVAQITSIPYSNPPLSVSGYPGSGPCMTTACTCPVSLLGGGVGSTTPSNQATLTATVIGNTLVGATYAVVNPGSGYVGLPNGVSLSGGTGNMVCSGMTTTPITITGFLTPGCVHMQDGAGGDTGICAPPATGAGILWNLPTTPGAAGQLPYLQTASNPASLSWTTAPWLGGPPTVDTFGPSPCTGALNSSSASSVGVVALSGGPNTTCGFKIHLPMATNGWSCSVSDWTSQINGNAWHQTTPSTQTAVTVVGNNAGTDNISFICLPY